MSVKNKKCIAVYFAVVATMVSFVLLLWRTIEECSILSVVGLASTSIALICYSVVLKSECKKHKQKSLYNSDSQSFNGDQGDG